MKKTNSSKHKVWRIGENESNRLIILWLFTADPHLCRLNPITGELETWVVLPDDDSDVFSWCEAMHGRGL